MWISLKPLLGYRSFKTWREPCGHARLRPGVRGRDRSLCRCQIPTAACVVCVQLAGNLVDILGSTHTTRQMPGMDVFLSLAMTTNNIEEEPDACLAAGMNGHICKPVEPDALCAALFHISLHIAGGRQICDFHQGLECFLPICPQVRSPWQPQHLSCRWSCRLQTASFITGPIQDRAWMR